jgi:hypothetical protein
MDASIKKKMREALSESPVSSYSTMEKNYMYTHTYGKTTYMHIYGNGNSIYIHIYGKRKLKVAVFK